MEEVIKKSIAANGSFAQRLRHWFYDKRWYFAAFFLPAAILFAAYAVFKAYPFGDNSALVLDLNGQYVYYYEAYRDAFWGDGSFIYDWSRNLGGEMFGIFAYYLASPFMLIIYILPRSMMPLSIMIMQLCKVGTASVTFRFFLKKISPVQPKTVSLIVFPTVYSLMSYMVVQLMDPMWLDALILLPLICVGVNKLVNNGTMLPYIIPLTLMFISHFYIGYMVGIFTFMYFCYTCLSKEGRKLPEHFFKKFGYFCLGTLVALMCAAFVLIPVYNSLKLGKFDFTTPDFSLATQFDFLTFATKLFPMSYDTVYPEGLPMIYCSTAVILLVPLFFMNSRLSIKEKTANGVLTGILVVLQGERERPEHLGDLARRAAVRRLPLADDDDRIVRAASLAELGLRHIVDTAPRPEAVFHAGSNLPSKVRRALFFCRIIRCWDIPGSHKRTSINCQSASLVNLHSTTRNLADMADNCANPLVVRCRLRVIQFERIFPLFSQKIVCKLAPDRVFRDAFKKRPSLLVSSILALHMRVVAVCHAVDGVLVDIMSELVCHWRCDEGVAVETAGRILASLSQAVHLLLRQDDVAAERV